MNEKKKFEVVSVDNYGDEFFTKVVEDFDLSDCVANVYLDGMRELMDSYIEEDENGVLKFDKKGYFRGVEDSGFMIVNGEGQLWWGESENSKVVREVKG